ncbi:MAG TPA: ABC-F family ATP-binding cassette domain-containing protein [Anaerolineaceae bacterium]|nr:ABC-F family ATP-binding cassette domain-containing protein [Anaerolineaceae bacterium]
MLAVNQLKKSFGLETLFEKVTFTLNAGERLGLVGPNGCGKTTLLRILTGEEKADGGSISLTPFDLRLGYLPQGFTFGEGESIGSFLDARAGDPQKMTAVLEKLASEMTSGQMRSGLQEEYDQALSALQLADENAGRLPAVLAGLGLAHFALETPAATLSGGQKTRLALAGVLLSAPQLLLLDEPTNHLDLQMLEWLEEWLGAFRGAALIVSHDRAFLDNTVTGILELDSASHTLRAYAGNYSDYTAQKETERERQWTAYYDQQAEIARLRGAARHLRDIARFRKGGKADTGDKFAKGFFANRGKATVGRALHVEERIDKLLTEERIDKPGRTWQMRMEFSQAAESGRSVITLDQLSVGYGEHVLLRDLNLYLRYGQRLALIGPNGSGKTTLLRTIAGRIPPLSGEARLGSNVRLGYMAQEQEDLHPEWDALTTIQSLMGQSQTEVRSFLSKYLFTGDDVFTPVGKLSYGERARLSLAGLVARGCNLLLLDEPINHLDIPSRARFEEALSAFEGTILAVIHDRYFIESFATSIWEVVEDQVVIRL